MIEKRVGKLGDWRPATGLHLAPEPVQTVLCEFPEAVVTLGATQWRSNPAAEPDPLSEVAEVFSVNEIRDRLAFLLGKDWITVEEHDDLARRMGVEL